MEDKQKLKLQIKGDLRQDKLNAMHDPGQEKQITIKDITGTLD